MHSALHGGYREVELEDKLCRNQVKYEDKLHPTRYRIEGLASGRSEAGRLIRSQITYGVS